MTSNSDLHKKLTYKTLFNHDLPMRTVPMVYPPFYRLENRGSENLSNLARVAWLVSGYKSLTPVTFSPQSENRYQGQSLGREIAEA